MSYTLSSTEPIAVYGGGVVGIESARRLAENGLNVKGIIDMEPSRVESGGFNVYTVNEFIEAFGHTIVVISLANAALHLGVAAELSKLGFERIILLPIQLRSQNAKTMIRLWNAVYCGDYGGTAPAFGALFETRAIDYILNESSGYVTALIHHSLVYTNKPMPEITKNDKLNVYHHYYKNKSFPERAAQEETVFDIPISSANASRALMDTPGYGDENIRKEKDRFRFDVSFFMFESPCFVSYDPLKNRFNLLDGYHRARFLLTQGMTGIPLKMRKDDFLRYFREPSAQKLMDYIRDWPTVPREIVHPAFAFLEVSEREPDAKFLRLLEDLYGGG